MTNAIEVENLCKSYQEFALTDVCFTVPQGRCCGLVGPNGAGKTTMLRIMTGLSYADHGTVRILGNDCNDPMLKDEIGILFDQPYFPEDWTALDIEKNLSPFYSGWNSGQYREYLSRFDISPRKRFSGLSLGMKRKLALAVCFSRDTRLLLLDEPMGGLDPAVRDEILELMREYLICEDRTILFSTHITDDLERIADDIVYISGGKVSYCGEKDHLLESFCIVRGGSLPEDKKASAIGVRQTGSGYECLMPLAGIGGLPTGTVTEAPTIHDIVVYMERDAQHGGLYTKSDPDLASTPKEEKSYKK